MASAAEAGEWAQRSCSWTGESLGIEGWEGLEFLDYKDPDPTARNTCIEAGGLDSGLWSSADGQYGDDEGAGEAWRYKAPEESTIAGGKLDVKLIAIHGLATVVVTAKSGLSTLARCDSKEGCKERVETVPITASGTELYESAVCQLSGPSCPHELDAEAGISSAEIVLETNAVPAVSAAGFHGTLLNDPTSGKGTLSFTATDPGPGVYQVRVLIDGAQAWAGTPNLNAGRCVVQGLAEGARAFDSAQPCPHEAPVSAEVATTGLADGQHKLTVEVEDAAGNTATVYSNDITTLNHPVSTAAPLLSPPPARGPANGTPASANATLTGQWKGQTASRLKSVYGRSHEITGKLTTTTATPIADALIEVSQTPASLNAKTTSLTSAHTNTQGNFLINLPPSTPSTSIQLVYRSHLGDPTPVATRTLTLQLPASIQLAVSPHITSVNHTIVLRGKLAGPIPPGGKKVLFEARVPGGSWIEFHNATVDSHGRFRATHHFTFPGPLRYQFRVVCEREADFPFLAGNSNVVHVRER